VEGDAVAVEGVDYERKSLIAKVWRFDHPVHGTLKIKRDAKFPDDKRIIFRLKLKPPGGGNPLEVSVGLCVSNADSTAIPDPGWHKPGYRGVDVSSVGYGLIDLRDLTGRRIIYLVHHVFALTGEELGVTLVVVEGIVNDDHMNPACVNSGISDYAQFMNSWQGPCSRVTVCALRTAGQHGWQ
jgi:hypothetical protein